MKVESPMNAEPHSHSMLAGDLVEMSYPELNEAPSGEEPPAYRPLDF